MLVPSDAEAVAARLGAAVRLERDLSPGSVSLRLHDWPGGRGPVVCLPGLLSTGRAFDGLAAGLAPAWRVIAVDPRGRGHSRAPRFGYSYQVHIADTISLVDQLGFEQVVLVGHSYGAIVALCLAAWYPERVAGLVLVDGGSELPPTFCAAVQEVARQLDMVYPSLDAYFRGLRHAPWLQPWSPEIEASCAASVEALPGGAVRALVSRTAVEQELRAYRGGPPDHPALQRAVACPTLVLRAPRGFPGDDDVALPEADFQALCARLPRGQGVQVPDTTHCTILLGRPQATIHLVRQFLGGLTAHSG